MPKKTPYSYFNAYMLLGSLHDVMLLALHYRQGFIKEVDETQWASIIPYLQLLVHGTDSENFTENCQALLELLPKCDFRQLIVDFETLHTELGKTRKKENLAIILGSGRKGLYTVVDRLCAPDKSTLFNLLKKHDSGKRLYLARRLIVEIVETEHSFVTQMHDAEWDELYTILQRELGDDLESAIEYFQQFRTTVNCLTFSSQDVTNVHIGKTLEVLALKLSNRNFIFNFDLLFEITQCYESHRTLLDESTKSLSDGIEKDLVIEFRDMILIQPAQRTMRYIMLLNTLMDNFRDGKQWQTEYHTELQSLLEAQKSLRSALTCIQACMRDLESKTHLQNERQDFYLKIPPLIELIKNKINELLGVQNRQRTWRDLGSDSWRWIQRTSAQTGDVVASTILFWQQQHTRSSTDDVTASQAIALLKDLLAIIEATFVRAVLHDSNISYANNPVLAPLMTANPRLLNSPITSGILSELLRVTTKAFEKDRLTQLTSGSREVIPTLSSSP